MTTRVTERASEDTARVGSWLGSCAAGAALLLGAAHAMVTVSSLVQGQAVPTPAYLVWVLLPVLGVVGAAAVALRLDRRATPGRWLVVLAGLVAAVAWLLALAGLLPLVLGNAGLPAAFAGPGPYALLMAPLYTVLVWRTRRTVGPVSRQRSAAP